MRSLENQGYLCCLARTLVSLTNLFHGEQIWILFSIHSASKSVTLAICPLPPYTCVSYLYIKTVRSRSSYILSPYRRTTSTLTSISVSEGLKMIVWHSVRSLLSLSIFVGFRAQAQSFVPDVSLCAPGSIVTSFSSCIYLENTLNQCNNLATTQEIVKCYCTQALLSSIYEWAQSLHQYCMNSLLMLHRCQNEWRLCSDTLAWDSEAEYLAAQWHVGCDKRISFTPTTPAISSLSVTLDPQICSSVFSSCDLFSLESSRCRESHTATSDILTCECQPKIVSLASVCEFDGNTSCLSIPAYTSKIYGHSICSKYQGGSVSNSTASSVLLDETPLLTSSLGYFIVLH